MGLADVRGIGDAVDRERPIAVVHARSVAEAEAAAATLRRAVTVSDEPAAAARVAGAATDGRAGLLRYRAKNAATSRMLSAQAAGSPPVVAPRPVGELGLMRAST